MKRILAAGSIAALAMIGFSATASAAPADAACFGQIHKTVNSGGVEGFDNRHLAAQRRVDPRADRDDQRDRHHLGPALPQLPGRPSEHEQPAHGATSAAR